MRDRGLVTVHRYIWSGGRRTLARRSRASALSILVLALATIGSLAASAAESHLAEFLPRATPQELFPGATRFGDPQGDPPICPIYVGAKGVGFVYLNSDFTGSVGYSGKPIRILVGIDTSGVVTGLKLVEHKEPIVLVGVPEQRVIAAVNKLIGTKVGPIASGAELSPQPDIVSGATVTVLVMADSIVRSAVRLIREGRLASGNAAAPAQQRASQKKHVDVSRAEVRDWTSLLGDGSIRRMKLSVGEVNAAFAKSGKPEAAANPELGEPDDVFIDLYTALASVPTIGKSLLGEASYEQLRKRLKPGQQAILVAADGRYSFKGSGYVRGGIFDRIEIEQKGSGTRFRDRNHERLGALQAQGAPELREIGLFTVPDDFAFDPTDPWTLRLLVQRAIG